MFGGTGRADYVVESEKSCKFVVESTRAIEATWDKMKQCVRYMECLGSSIHRYAARIVTDGSAWLFSTP